MLLKVLEPGRVLLITHASHVNKLAILLQMLRGKTPSYHVLVLTDPKTENLKDQKSDLWYKMLSLAKEEIFVPSGSPGHEMLLISPNDIFEITDKTIKLDYKLVVDDIQKRQIERFRDNPVGQTCQLAVQELHKLSVSCGSNTSGNTIVYLHLIRDLKMKGIETHIFERVQQIYELKDKLIDYLPSTRIPNFEKQFEGVFARTFLFNKKKSLEHFLSSASLSLYPDYENRIELLRKFQYVDAQNRGVYLDIVVFFAV